MNGNENDYFDDDVLVGQLRESLSGLRVAARTPLDLIVDRGRTYQRRRRARYAGLGVTGVVASTVLALGLTGVFSTAAPGGSAGTNPTAAGSLSTGVFRTAAFTLIRNANGTATLSLTHSDMLDPATLQQVLDQHGIPALVKTDTYCTSSPALPDPVRAGVLSIQPPGTSSDHMAPVPANGGLNPAAARQLIDHTVTVINPAKIPTGAELYFGYFGGQGLFTTLITIDSHTCTSDTGSTRPPTAPASMQPAGPPTKAHR